MPLLFLAILIGIPIVEISVFVEIGGEIGALNTIILTILTAIAGMALLRYQGVSVLLKAQENLNSGISPVNEIFNGILLAVAGLFLLIPGFVTDALGFLLFLPPLRNSIAKFLSTRTSFVQNPNARGFQSHSYQQDSTVIEGEYSVVQDTNDLEDSDPNPDSPWSKKDGP